MPDPTDLPGPGDLPHLPEVTEVVEGELDVRLGPHRCRVLVPAGVGLPGFDDQDLAGLLVAELVARHGRVPQALDASVALASEPGLLAALETRADEIDEVVDDTGFRGPDGGLA